MEAILRLGVVRSMLLVTSVVLTFAGFAGLVRNANTTRIPAARTLSPSWGPPNADIFSSPTSTSTTAGRAGRGRTWVGGDYLDAPIDDPNTPTTDPGPAEAPTQVDVAVPAAGAQVSFGSGPGSCTDVAITALTPDDCPPPDGDGAVVVDPGPQSGDLRPKSSSFPA